MHHAAAANLQPTPLPTHIHLGRRFGEGEERRPETHLQVSGFKIILQEIGDHTLQVGKADALTNPQSFHLMEHGRMGGIGIHTIDATRRDDANVRHDFQMLVFRPMRLHVADLNRRSMRAQHVLFINVECVVHRTCRMIRGNIQRGKVVKIVLDLRSFSHRESDRMEQGGDTLQRAGDRMQSTHARTAPRQRNIQRLTRKFGLQCLLLNGIAPCLQRRFDLLLDLVDARACRRTFCGGEFAQPLQQSGQAALLAEIPCFGVLQLCRIDYRGKTFQCVIENYLKFLHCVMMRS